MREKNITPKIYWKLKKRKEKGCVCECTSISGGKVRNFSYFPSFLGIDLILF